MALGKCKFCGSEIAWIKTVGGKSMPCDSEQVYYKEKSGGKERIVTPNGQVLACEIIPEGGDIQHATGFGYIPHFATCPRMFRKRKE